MSEKSSPDHVEEPHGGAADDEAHRKFREALDRKKKAHHDAHEASAKSGVGKSQNAKTTRQFRRKAGG